MNTVRIDAYKLGATFQEAYTPWPNWCVYELDSESQNPCPMRAVNFHGPRRSMTRVSPIAAAPLNKVNKNSADARTPSVGRDNGTGKPLAGSAVVPSSSSDLSAAELDSSAHPA